MKLSIGNRVAFAIGLLLFLFFVVSAVSFLLTNQTGGHFSRLARVDNPRKDAVLEMAIALAETARTVSAYAVAHRPADREKALQAQEAFARSASAYNGLASSDSQRALVDEVGTLFEEFKRSAADIVAASDGEAAGIGDLRSALEGVRAVLAEPLAQAAADQPLGAPAEAIRAAQARASDAFVAIEFGVDVNHGDLKETAREVEAEVTRFLATSAATAASDDARQRLERLGQALATVKEGADQIRVLVERRHEMLARLEQQRQGLNDLLNGQMLPPIRAAMADTERNVEFSTNSAIIFLLVMTVAGIVVGGGTALLLTRGLVRPILALKGSADAIGRGMLDHRISVESEDEIGQLAATFNRMAESRQKSEDALRELAHQDPLTKLPNRTLFHRRLIEAMDNSTRISRLVAVHFLDLDNFKDVNDTLGHPSGDMLLRHVGERLKRCIRVTDTVARLGGDEFAIVQTNLEDYSGIPVLARRAIDSLSKPYDIDGESVYTGVSIGITVYPYDGKQAETLLKNADLALYRAKQEGRNMYQVYDPEMNAEIQARKALEQDLRRALENGGSNELLLNYQPQIGIDAGHVVGAEALVRWRHPERGMISPGEFIPVAEQSGLITHLTEAVLRQACAQIKRWEELKLPPIRVSVNLSAADFKRKDLVAMVKRTMEEAGVDPQYVELEITESMVMTGAETVIATLHDLKELGVELAIDDFGTGFSSMSYLKQFPVDRLKIDQAFVRDIPENKEDASITEAIIKLGHTFELKVIAEGVETEEQLAFLRDRECDEAQGYFFSRPVEAEQFVEFVVNHVPREVQEATEVAFGPIVSPGS